MTIQGQGSKEEVTIEVSGPYGYQVARLTVCADGDMVSVSINSNHLDALEAAVKAVRLEIDARAVGA